MGNPLYDIPEGIYPNPAGDAVQVATKTEGKKSMQVIDTTGKLVLEQKVERRLGTLDIRSLPPGQYVVKVGGIPSFN